MQAIPNQPCQAAPPSRKRARDGDVVAELVQDHGPGKASTSTPLSTTPFTIGRANHASLQIMGKLISREHATIR